MNKSLKQVEQFHKTFNHPVKPNPIIPSKERCDLRVELISEELKELQEAIGDKNMVEIADALCDLKYVLNGAILEFGLGEKFDSLFDEVQRSNISKGCKTLEEAKSTVEFYENERKTRCYYRFNEECKLYVVYRTFDDKVLKNINYSAAELKPILDA